MVRLKRRVIRSNSEVGEGLGAASYASSSCVAIVPPVSLPKHGAEHLTPHQFKPGQGSANPGGRPKNGLPRMGSRNMMQRVWAAMDQIETETGKDYVQELLRAGMKSESVRNTLLAKFLPSKIEDIVTIDDVKRVVGKVVSIIKKYVKDKDTFSLIAREVATIQLTTSQSPKVGVINAKAPRKKS